MKVKNIEVLSKSKFYTLLCKTLNENHALQLVLGRLQCALCMKKEVSQAASLFLNHILTLDFSLGYGNIFIFSFGRHEDYHMLREEVHLRDVIDLSFLPTSLRICDLSA